MLFATVHALIVLSMHVCITLLLPAAKVPYTKEDYEAAKARDPDFYRGADSLEYGRAPNLPEGNVDKMVNELVDRWVGYRLGWLLSV